MPTPRFLALHQPDDPTLAAEAAAGLLQPAAAVSPKFFYDALGSRLFDAITELPEYTPMRDEASLMARHGADIAAAALQATGPAPTLVDLGAGNGAKAARLFATLKPRRYVAVDISLDYLRQALQSLQDAHPQLPMWGLGMDFSGSLAWPPDAVEGPALLFYPGSSIGNFAPPQARAMLRRMRVAAQGGAVLVGVDMAKPAEQLQEAYDDALGVTAAFNLNLLRHLNRVLKADFEVRQWQHRVQVIGDCPAVDGAQPQRVEMHLVAREALQVRWPGGTRRFAAGEHLHTEDSWKWTPGQFEALLREAGFADVLHWGGPADGFAIFLAA